MKNFLAIGAVGAAILTGLGVTFVVIGLMMVIETANRDAESKVRIEKQEQVRNIYFDKLYKIIEQKTEITKASSQLQKDLVKTLIEGRSATFIKIINESNPEKAFDRQQFNDLANTIEAQREGFFREQEKLLDLVRENHTLHASVVSGALLSFWGRKPVDQPVIVTSDHTETVTKTGKDNDVKLGL